MTLYTAIGKYELHENAAGDKLPHVLVHGEPKSLDIWEMITWSSLMWKILTFDELAKEFYAKEREAHILGEYSCEACLKRMEQRGLIVCGHGATAMDALADLLSELYVIPLRAKLPTKILAFLHLTFAKGVPFRVTRQLFTKPQLSDGEAYLLQAAEQELLTVDELVDGRTDHAGLRDVVSLYFGKHILFEKLG